MKFNNDYVFRLNTNKRLSTNTKVILLACKPIFQKIDTLYEKASIEVEGKHFDLDILMGGDMKYLQLVLGKA
jgi:pyrroline-5-carboxylate reductase